jgi:hypothetical protein
MNNSYFRSTAARFDTTFIDIDCKRRFFDDGSLGRSGISTQKPNTDPLVASSSTDFVLAGVPSGQKYVLHLKLAINGTIGPAATGATGAPIYLVRAMLDGNDNKWLTKYWTTSGHSEFEFAAADTLSADLSVTSGEPFRLTTSYNNFYANPYLDHLDITAQWLFGTLPPGATITSCHGYGGSPVPTGLALASADAYLDHVDLAWVGGDVSTSFTVERSDADGVASWSPLATVLADGSGRIAYRDGSVAAGAAYRYRLRGSNGSTAPEADVHIPATARLTLAISGAQPVHGPLQFAVTRPGSAPAKLELFDVAGRLVQSHVFAAGGAPSEQVALDPVSGRAGIFLARLTCGRESRAVRVVRVP